MFLAGIAHVAKPTFRIEMLASARGLHEPTLEIQCSLHIRCCSSRCLCPDVRERDEAAQAPATPAASAAGLILWHPESLKDFLASQKTWNYSPYISNSSKQLQHSCRLLPIPAGSCCKATLSADVHGTTTRLFKSCSPLARPIQFRLADVPQLFAM